MFLLLSYLTVQSWFYLHKVWWKVPSFRIHRFPAFSRCRPFSLQIRLEPLCFFFFPVQCCQLGCVRRPDASGDLCQSPPPHLPGIRPLPGNLPVTSHCDHPALPWRPMGRPLSVSALPGGEHQRAQVVQVHEGVFFFNRPFVRYCGRTRSQMLRGYSV